MNLREANVMRAQMAELRINLHSLENRLKMVEDGLVTCIKVTDLEGALTARGTLSNNADPVENVFHVKRKPGRPRKLDGGIR